MWSVVRSRIVSSVLRNNKNACNFRRVFTSDAVASAPKKVSFMPSQSIVEGLAAAEAQRKSAWRFLKYGLYGLVGAFTGAGYIGYVTWAYSLDEIKEKRKSLHDSVNYKARDDASAAEKLLGLLYFAAMTVPAKVVENYLIVRWMTEETFQSFDEPEKLLPDLDPAEQHVFTLVLDLNETLVDYDWEHVGGPLFKRSGVDDFLEHMAKFYEIVVYTDEMGYVVEHFCEELDKNK